MKHQQPPGSGNTATLNPTRPTGSPGRAAHTASRRHDHPGGSGALLGRPIGGRSIATALGAPSETNHDEPPHGGHGITSDISTNFNLAHTASGSPPGANLCGCGR